MPLTLEVDADRWRAHARAYVSGGTRIVPVTKGNGYSFGNSVLAAEASTLDVDTMAVGTYEEVSAATGPFRGDVLVLSPWRPGVDVDRVDEGRVIHTVSRLTDLRDLAESDRRPRVVVEVLTTMRRHGIAPTEIGQAVSLLDQVRFEGWALHLPLAGDRLAQARDLARLFVATSGSEGHRLWLSHLDRTDAAKLATETSAELRLRVGTALWLGERSAYRTRASVLDMHAIRRGQPYGYRQRRATRDGVLLVVAGGTAHGIAMEAPTPAANMRQRAVAVGTGGLAALGRVLSPYHVAGRRRWFAEPPHMQCSLIWLPPSADPPAIGDEVDVDVRFTTTMFDRIVWT
ncbi:MAG TPA: alanine racemase [Jiangellaceae bacterium]|nr:alanine racemase [Jiangellaceae bacterium]